jgi:hypothetical protein
VSSTAICVSPVILPPGRARLLTSSVPMGSGTTTKTIGIVEVACRAATAASLVTATRTSGLRDKLNGKLLEPLGDFIGKPVVQRNGLAVDVTEPLHASHESAEIDGFLFGAPGVPQNRDARYSVLL